MFLNSTEDPRVYRLASLSARIVGILQRRLKDIPPIEGDSYVVEEGCKFLRSLRNGGLAIAGDSSVHIDEQAATVLPVAIESLSFLRDQLARAELVENDDFRKFWEDLTQAMEAVLSGKERGAEKTRLTLGFFDRLERVLSDELQAEPVEEHGN